MTFTTDTPVAVIGAGTMGAGIAQIAATHGHRTYVVDTSADQLARAEAGLRKILARQVEKGRMMQEAVDGALGRMTFTSTLDDVADAGLVVEAIVERLDVKQGVFERLEALLGEEAVIASNTSSLSITAIAGACRQPERVLGVHFFNPAPLLPLVEIVPGMATDEGVLRAVRALVDGWGKTTVVARDTPGFIVNRVARPFYGEAIRILEEGIADAATIDWAMTELGGFRMGPFTLMDLIGNDVNYAVTESVWTAFHYDPRYQPSFTQRRMVEAGRLGRKSGQGYFPYGDGAERPAPTEDRELGQRILDRIVAMLVNEAADAVFWGIATREDVDLAMTKGVNYPKGLLAWGDEIGAAEILARLEALRERYAEPRYRPSPYLRDVVEARETLSGA